MEIEHQLPTRYKKRGVLGKGTAGEVFKVKDTIGGKIIALKILDNVETNAAKTLVNEFKTLSSLDHIGLIKVYDFGLLENSIPYFTMEVVDGENIASFLSKSENLHLLPDILEQIITALSYLHNKNILHGDIKPENIMITNKEAEQISVKLLDFGLASVSTTIRKNISGTPRFLAPEILNNAKYSESSDLYALGMTLIECITGEKAPPASEIKDKFYEKSYKLLSMNLSSSGINNAFSLSSFILNLCRIGPDERITDSKEALQEINLLISKNNHDQIKLNENILIGRNKEIEKINTFLSYDKFNGKTFILEGKRGIGKKRLIAEALKMAQLAGQLVFDLSNEIYSDKSFDRFIETLSENLPEKESKKLLSSHNKILSSIAERKKSTKLGKEDSSVIIYDNIIQFIHKFSKRKSVLFIIPDIDRFSIDFQRFIIHLSYETGFLVSKIRIIISKQTKGLEEQVRKGIYRELAALESSTVMQIKPLTLNQFRLLIEKLTGEDILREKEISDLYNKTLGIPLYLVEILKQFLRQEILENIRGSWHLNRMKLLEFKLPDNPDDISNMSYRELKRAEKNLLQFISIYGNGIKRGILNKLLETNAEESDSLVKTLTGKNFLKEKNGTIRFINPFLHETIQRHTSWKKMVKVNKIIAETLEKSESADSKRMAIHFIAAGDIDRAFKYGLTAAEELAGRYENYECYDILNKLKKLIKRKGSNNQLKPVLKLLAHIELMTGLVDRAIKDYKTLVELSAEEIERAEYYKELGIIYSDYLGKKKKPIYIFNEALSAAYRAGGERLKSEILLELSDLIEDKRIVFAEKAAEIAKKTDINIYGYALSKLLYRNLLSGDKNVNHQTLHKLKEILNQVNDSTKNKILAHILVYYFFNANYQKAKEYIDLKLDLEEKTNDEISRIFTLRQLGGIYYANGEFHKTIDILKNTSELHLKYKELLGFQADIANISLAYTCLAEYNKAISHLHKGENAFKKLGVQKIFHRFYGKFCLIYLTLGDMKKMDFEIYYKKSRDSALQNNNKMRFGHTQLYKTLFYYQRLQCGKTTKYIQKALESFRKTNDRDDIVDALITLSMIKLEDNKTEEAAEHLKEARAIFDEIHCRYLEPALLLAEGALARRRQTQETEKVLGAGLKLSKKMGTRETTWQLYRQLALYYKSNGEMNKALANYRDSVETIRQITESIDGDKLKTSYLSVPFRKRVFEEIKSLKKSI